MLRCSIDLLYLAYQKTAVCLYPKYASCYTEQYHIGLLSSLFLIIERKYEHFRIFFPAKMKIFN